MFAHSHQNCYNQRAKTFQGGIPLKNLHTTHMAEQAACLLLRRLEYGVPTVLNYQFLCETVADGLKDILAIPQDKWESDVDRAVDACSSYDDAVYYKWFNSHYPVGDREDLTIVTKECLLESAEKSYLVGYFEDLNELGVEDDEKRHLLKHTSRVELLPLIEKFQSFAHSEESEISQEDREFIIELLKEVTERVKKSGMVNHSEVALSM